MFNPKRAAQFLGKALAVLLPIVVVLYALGLGTEFYRQGADPAELDMARAFWLAGLRNSLPGLAAVIGVYLLAAQFARAVYGIETFGEARSFIHRRLFGLFKFGPWRRVQAGILEDADRHVLMQTGGPGNLVVYSDSAVVLHRAGTFTAVQKTGFVQLKPFEKPCAVVDLRPARRVCPVEVMSSEGIPVVCVADISFQIDDQGAMPTATTPFPAKDEKVFLAAIGKWVLQDDPAAAPRAVEWSERLAGYETEVALRAIVAGYTLDRLVGLDPLAGGNPREDIRQELQTRLEAAAQQVGARILRVELADIQVKDDVTRQWIEAWRARWEKWVVEQHTQGKVRQIELLESAKTAAQAKMIDILTTTLRPLTKAQAKVSSKLVLTRLLMALSRAAADPLTRVYLPQEAVQTLKALRKLVA